MRLSKSSPSSGPSVLVLSDDLSQEGGIRTRILGELSVLNPNGRITLIARLRPRGLKILTDASRDLKAKSRTESLAFVPMLPHGGIAPLMEVVTALNIILLTTAGLVESIGRGYRRIYAHNFECGFAGVLLGAMLRIPVTIDFHSDLVEENAFLNSWKVGGIRRSVWLNLTRILVELADKVVCVSMRHRDHIARRYGRSASVVVIPCCTDFTPIESLKTRDSTRNELALGRPDSIVLFYSGSTSKYQLVEKMVAFYETLKEESPDCAFVLLVPGEEDRKLVQNLFKDQNKASVFVKSVSHDLVASFAAASDIAFLLREDVLMNQISSPTKFAEYLISGLPVLITPNVGDYSDSVRSRRLGAVVDIKKATDKDYVMRIFRSILDDSTIRARCREHAVENLTWQSYSEAVNEAYLG